MWQIKYWEHTIESPEDLDPNLNDTHYNPVKHGYVRDPRNRPWTTIHRWVEAETQGGKPRSKKR